jgi:hypothetical protein
MGTKLTVAAKAEFTKCEEIIEKGISTFVEVGMALLKVKESGWYLEEYKTWEEYCDKRWHRSDSWARKHISAVEFLDNKLPAESTTGRNLPVVDNETLKLGEAIAQGQMSRTKAEEIAAQPNGARQQAIKDHFAGKDSGNGKPKKASKKKRLAYSEDQRDGPQAEMEKVNHNIEVWCRAVSDLAKQCPEDAWISDRRLREGVIRKLKEACDFLRTVKCHALCPKCEGEGCTSCLKTGRMPKVKYDQLV